MKCFGYHAIFHYAIHTVDGTLSTSTSTVGAFMRLIILGLSKNDVKNVYVFAIFYKFGFNLGFVDFARLFLQKFVSHFKNGLG